MTHALRKTSALALVGVGLVLGPMATHAGPPPVQTPTQWSAPVEGLVLGAAVASRNLRAGTNPDVDHAARLRIHIFVKNVGTRARTVMVPPIPSGLDCVITHGATKARFEPTFYPPPMPLPGDRPRPRTLAPGEAFFYATIEDVSGFRKVGQPQRRWYRSLPAGAFSVRVDATLIGVKAPLRSRPVRLQVAAAAGAKPRPELATVRARCEAVMDTGKRHNTFFFRFRITQVLEGSFSGRFFSSRELASDFGGKQLVAKLGPRKVWRRRRVGAAGRWAEPTARSSCKHELIVRLGRWPGAPSWSMLWAARVERQRALRELERLALALIDAVAKDDYAHIAPYVSPRSGFDRRLFAAIRRHHGHDERDDFARVVLAGLLQEHHGRVIVGGGTARWSLAFEQVKGTDRWLISKALWRP